MSIPLDRLYHYLDSLSGNNIIIYRWFPHGAKNLEDLDVMDSACLVSSWQESLTKNYMICHDQEPLDYNYYSVDLCAQRARELAKKKLVVNPAIPWCHSDTFINLLAGAHLRSAITYPTNFNDNILLCHSEKNSEQLKIYEQNGYIGVYYWSHALIARDWYRYARHDQQLVPSFDKINYDFLIYNRAWSGSREYRLKIVELLVENELLPHCYTKFNPYDNNIHYTQHIFVNKSLEISNTNFEDIIPLNTTNSHSSADYSSDDYQMTGIELVLETLFDDSRIHLTEKILRPIACGRPFILAGTPGSLEYIKAYGFKTFNGLINETYDTVADPLLRLKAIVAELKRISQMSARDKKELWQKLYDIASYNRDRFFSDQFHQDITNEFIENVDAGVHKCSQTMTGKWWKLSRDPSILGREVPSTEMSEWADTWLKNYAQLTK